MPARGTIFDAAGMTMPRDATAPTWEWTSNPPRPGETLSQQDKVLHTTDDRIKEVLFGGAPGGGKTHLLIAMAYLHVMEFGRDAIVGMFRQETPEFRDILNQATKMYMPLEGKWNDRDRMWRFPNGGTIQMTYLRNMEDAFGHKGAAYSLLLWDEVTGWHDEAPYEFLQTRLRSTNVDLFCQSVATANPDGPGMWWVRERWKVMDPAVPPETPFHAELDEDVPEDAEASKRVFIPSLLQDNPHLNRDNQYRDALYAIKDHARREAYVKGDWSVFVGQAYPEFDERFHVCDRPFIPSDWTKWAALDWGSSTPYCVLYFAKDPIGHIFVWREVYGADMKRKNMGLSRSASEVAREEWGHATERGVRMMVVDPSIYNRTGHEKTIADDWAAAGWVMQRGNRDRRTRGEKIRDVLQTVCSDGKPILQIADQCINLRRTIPLLVMDDYRPELIKDGGEDHAWDTLGYGLLSTFANQYDAGMFDDDRGLTNGAYKAGRDWTDGSAEVEDDGQQSFQEMMAGRLTR